MILVPNWTKVGTEEELVENIGNNFALRIGWTESATDTLYTEEIPTYGSVPKYKVSCWNEPNIRGKLVLMLGQPIWRI